ncbi:putative P7 protein [Cherry-associated luteovirus]|uniref:Putative P7 protein n=1 Tax=Cherry-associated luteovirus TaxID=1912598 RepID=A0A1I9W771_9TOMB|nr:putative P7 protein [Cherry-associated luteovirus]APA23022.1 putative P7 protein [Cherry-associated luteovirus]
MFLSTWKMGPIGWDMLRSYLSTKLLLMGLTLFDGPKLQPEWSSCSIISTGQVGRLCCYKLLSRLTLPAEPEPMVPVAET